MHQIRTKVVGVTKRNSPGKGGENRQKIIARQAEKAGSYVELGDDSAGIELIQSRMLARLGKN